MTPAADDCDEMPEEFAAWVATKVLPVALRLLRGILLAVTAMALGYGQRYIAYPIAIVGLLVFVLGALRATYPVAIAVIIWLGGLVLVPPEMAAILKG